MKAVELEDKREEEGIQKKRKERRTEKIIKEKTGEEWGIASV